MLETGIQKELLIHCHRTHELLERCLSTHLELSSEFGKSAVIRRRSFHVCHQVVIQTFKGVFLWDAYDFARRMCLGEFGEKLYDQLDRLHEAQLRALERVLNSGNSALGISSSQVTAAFLETQAHPSRGCCD